MATLSSTSSSTSSALTEVVTQTRVEKKKNDIAPMEDDVDFEDWTANNALVISWIRLTIDESLSSSLSHINDSNELWIHIQKRFGVKNGQRVQRLKTELANCRQKGLAIEAYYGKLTQLWGSLADYQRAKTMEEVRKEREEDKLHQFLMGLDDTLYGAVKSNLLSRVPLPSLEEAYNALTLDEEAKHLSRDNDVRVDGVSFIVQANTSRKPFENRAGYGVCNICGRTGHIAENCFRKIGYPEWWGENLKSNTNFRNKSGNNSSKANSNHGGTGRGTTTTSVGSMMGKNSNSAQLNNVLTNSAHVNTIASTNSPLTSADRVGISGLNTDQWNLLVKILEERKSNTADHQSAVQSSSEQPDSPSPYLIDNELFTSHNSFDDSSHDFPEENSVTPTPSVFSPMNSLEPAVTPIITSDTAATPNRTEHVSEKSQLQEKEIVPERDSSSVTTTSGSELHEKSSNVDPTVISSSNDEEPEPEIEKLGFGYRKKQPPVRLADYVTSLIYTPSPSETPYPIDNFLSSSQFSDKYQAYLFAITSGVEPQHYNEAVLDENWRFAVKDEIEALEENGTWTVEDLPPDKKAIGCKWVFRLKYNADGSLERHKARLVVLGNNNQEGIDYSETFAPVAKMITVRAFLQQAASLDWEVHQMDVHNAFLHGDLNEEVYMKFPPGFRTDDNTKVCRLRKSLYGLKQAPRCWFAKLGSAMKEYGFEQDISNYSLFTLATANSRLHVLVYVDDLIITGSSIHLVNEFKHYLSSCFRMKNLGILRYFLGIEVARSPAGIYLCQRKYALDIISETGLMGVKPISFPLEQNHKLSLAKDGAFSDPTRYRRLVGRLIYLGNTRPELSYAIHILSQFMNAPQNAHWNAALRVVRYLKNSPGQGILLRANTPLILTAWCDSDHGACPITSRSLTGWFIQFGDSPLSWKTRKHDVVSRSSAEAEYRAMADTVQELLWLRELLPSLGIQNDGRDFSHRLRWITM
ncbi:unnamed protein product [Arabidopsis halleri]